jgi:RAP1 GTPase activating protein 1
MALSTTIIDKEHDYKYYREIFFDKEHTNWVAEQYKNQGPFIISILKAKIEDDSYPAIIWNPHSPYFLEKILISSNDIKIRPFHSQPIEKDKLLALKNYKPSLPYSRFQMVKEIDFPNQLFHLENSQSVQGYKFGVLYAKEGQVEENDMFSNINGSEIFEKFLSLLGEKITLNGWKKYKAGLDVKSDSTGIYSIYTNFSNFEIMFHVSTLLPYYPNDSQQLERKRHIGNDIVVIIFMDGNTPYSPDTISSEFNHVFIIIQPIRNINSNEVSYKVGVAMKTGIPQFGPLLKESYVHGSEFREFLLTKLINAERASYYAPTFASKITRTRQALMNEIINKS